MRLPRAILLGAICASGLAAGNGSASADAKLCARAPAFAATALNRVYLLCNIRQDKVVAITNNTGHAIDASRTPFSYEAIGKYDQKHWCRTFNSGVLAVGSETKIGDRPYTSCTAWYTAQPMAKQSAAAGQLTTPEAAPDA
jgi:hypothetical protein